MIDDRIDAGALEDYTTSLMVAHRIDEREAAVVSANMIWNELAGRSSHGILRLPIQIERHRRGVLRSPCRPRFEPVAAAMERLDGDGGFGQYVAGLGMRRAIELAAREGLGVVGIRNSNFFGTGAYYVQLAAAAGNIGLAFSNSVPNVVAHGGRRAVFGTNPLAFSAPQRNGRGLLVDMATSARSGSAARGHLHSNEPLPEGVAIDSEGRPTTDPAKLAQGALLPVAGPKGTCLALLVEVLSGVVTGAGISHGVGSMYSDFTRSGDNGHFMMAIDVSRWMPPDDFYERIERLVGIVRASGDDGQVRLPGEIRWRNYDDNLARGIHVPADIREKLEELSRPHAVAAPW